VRRHILHISDLHLNRESIADQKLVLDAFLRDLVQLTNSGWVFDLLIFSGDIVRAADFHDDYLDAAETIEAITKTIKLTESRVVFCPGNHDAHDDQRPTGRTQRFPNKVHDA
jgi:predicted MPP superfamily phosphohydrolase